MLAKKMEKLRQVLVEVSPRWATSEELGRVWFEVKGRGDIKNEENGHHPFDYLSSTLPRLARRGMVAQRDVSEIRRELAGLSGRVKYEYCYVPHSTWFR